MKLEASLLLFLVVGEADFLDVHETSLGASDRCVGKHESVPSFRLLRYIPPFLRKLPTLAVKLQPIPGHGTASHVFLSAELAPAPTPGKNIRGCLRIYNKAVSE